MSRVNADRIVWTNNTLQELRGLLGNVEIEVEDEILDNLALEFPWPVYILDIDATHTSSGQIWITVKIGFDPVIDATQYEVRLTEVEAYVAYPNLDYVTSAGGGGGSSTTTLPRAVVTGDIAIAACRADVGSVSGGWATWTRISHSSEVDLWVGTGVGSGTTVTASGSSPYTEDLTISCFTGLASVTLRNIQRFGVGGVPATISAPAVDAVLGDIAISSTVCTHSFLTDTHPLGLNSSTGFGASQVAYASSGGAAGQGICTISGQARAESIDAVFDVYPGDSVSGSGEALNASFSWVAL